MHGPQSGDRKLLLMKIHRIQVNAGNMAWVEGTGLGRGDADVDGGGVKASAGSLSKHAEVTSAGVVLC